MSGLYLVDMLDWLRDGGCQVAENATTNGWQKRARSSGGFPLTPLGVWWHHTASKTSPANDLAWMIVNCDDAPVGNLLLDRTGTYWPIAAGASNCAGKGGPWAFSRGSVPADQGNTRGVQIEVANNGVGEAWPEVQIDAYFRGSNILNARLGNLPTDVVSHQAWAPTRKIDPATAAAVQGRWRPRSVTSSGTWSLPDIQAECLARATTPDPPPGPEEDEDMNTPAIVWMGNGRVDHYVRGSDAQLWHIWWEREAACWSDWQCLGGTLTSSPNAFAVEEAPGLWRVDVAARGSDGALYHIVWQDSIQQWGGWEQVAQWP